MRTAQRGHKANKDNRTYIKQYSIIIICISGGVHLCTNLSCCSAWPWTNSCSSQNIICRNTTCPRSALLRGISFVVQCTLFKGMYTYFCNQLHLLCYIRVHLENIGPTINYHFFNDTPKQSIMTRPNSLHELI